MEGCLLRVAAPVLVAEFLWSLRVAMPVPVLRVAVPMLVAVCSLGVPTAIEAPLWSVLVAAAK